MLRQKASHRHEVDIVQKDSIIFHPAHSYSFKDGHSSATFILIRLWLVSNLGTRPSVHAMGRLEAKLMGIPRSSLPMHGFGTLS